MTCVFLRLIHVCLYRLYNMSLDTRHNIRTHTFSARIFFPLLSPCACNLHLVVQMNYNWSTLGFCHAVSPNVRVYFHCVGVMHSYTEVWCTVCIESLCAFTAR